MKEENNRKEISKFIMVIGLVLLLTSVIYAVMLNIEGFQGQSDPFNITFTGQENKTYYIAIPRYTYLNNLTINLTGFIIE